MAGTGIGLYCKEYVKMHNGSVVAESRENKGTTFSVCLFKGNSHLNPAQIITEKDFPDTVPGTSDYYTINGLSETSGHFEQSEPVHTVLLIEDNPELIGYLIDNLADRYNLISAFNGSEGFEKTLEYNPDIVISDVMMPLVDGFTYCQKVKTDTRTSHIPVILLTARNLDDDKIKGLSIGADDYLIKPFQLSELKLRIKYHLEQREKVRQQFLKDFKIKSDSEFILSVKDQFLQKVFSFTEQYFWDDQFGVEKLSELILLKQSIFIIK
jgi:response regulator RpfG family c-di-GMP phosphodiesterase